MNNKPGSEARGRMTGRSHDDGRAVKRRTVARHSSALKLPSHRGRDCAGEPSTALKRDEIDPQRGRDALDPLSGNTGCALGRTHVFLATLGVAVFAMAAILALLYLVQERRLKRKQFAAGATAEAPLALLDRLALRCVSVGFPIFTVALVTGAVWIARLGGIESVEARRPEYLFAVAAWVTFGVLLLARVGAGWQGRRAAWLTLGGFGGMLFVLIAYVLRYAA